MERITTACGAATSDGPTSGESGPMPRAADELHAYLAHELRTPLAAMVGLAEVARHGAAAGKGGRRIEESLSRIVGIGRELGARADQTPRLARLGRSGSALKEKAVAFGSFAASRADCVRGPPRCRWCRHSHGLP